MPVTTIIGIDPGLKGSMVTLDAKKPGSLKIDRLPTKVEQRILKSGGGLGKPINSIDTEALQRILSTYDPATTVAFLEDVRSMPTDGRRAAFTFGRVKAAIETALSTQRIPVLYVTPSVWKTRMRCTGLKRNARVRCEAIYPDVKFKSIDDCEAALIATYGILFGLF